MENASKALLIAAAVLIVIILISGAILILKSGNNTEKQASEIGEKIDSATHSVAEEIQIGLNNGGNRGQGGTGETKEYIGTNRDYIGCYADMDDDGEPEGIIYADLAFTVSDRKWNNKEYWCGYGYSAKSDLKKYYIKEKNYNKGYFGTADIISPVKGTTGNDRFYVMALKDISNNTFSWYTNAHGKLDKYEKESYNLNDFGKGKSYTVDMLKDWNNERIGKQHKDDLWGVIQNQQIKQTYPLVHNEDDTGKWFVPSKSEWAAFGDFLYTKLGVNTSNYNTRMLSDAYWSSLQVDECSASLMEFFVGELHVDTVEAKEHYVRLSATF